MHVADMPNNKKPPVDDDSYQAKRALVDHYQLPVHLRCMRALVPIRHLCRSHAYKA